ncbi:MAG: diguanylate cyclase [Betaproteobacteria bacterium]|nr:diguanylate cyclase [Betaproteobacteria bacterium]
MKPIQHPSEIAREALKLLSARKLSPTPANYQECYYEIAEKPHMQGFPEDQLRQIALALKAHNVAQQEQLDQLDLAIRKHSWKGVGLALQEYVQQGIGSESSEGGGVAPPAAADASAYARDCFSKVAGLIDSMRPALADEDEGFAEQMGGVVHTLRDPMADIQVVRDEFDLFCRRLAFAAEEQGQIKHALLKLLHVIIENISKLIMEDSWLEGQVAALIEAVSPPLSLRRLDDVERRIRDVMYKQATAKERAIEAQAEIREMLGTFIERLAAMNDSSTRFHGRLEDGARKLEQVKTLEDMAPLLSEVIQATRTMAEDTERSREELAALREKVQATESEIAKLHLELNNASAMARHDPLTNTLNRKGLDEVMVREIAAMQRKGTSLSLALLDIDNFKQLNDRLGHAAGDEALVHLVGVVRACIRLSDSLARYGGEEFVVLMPDTPLDEAMTAMSRLQRELTRNFFLANNEKVLITFSAGVAQLATGESQEDAYQRADAAMYLAKRAGKNRVLAG